MAVVEESNVPIKPFRPTTHVAIHCFDDAIAMAKMGGQHRTSTPGWRLEVPNPGQGPESGPWIKSPSAPSSSGSMPIWNGENELIGMGVGKMDTSTAPSRRVTEEGGHDLFTALKLVTENVQRFGDLSPQGGALLEGSDADVLSFGQRKWTSTLSSPRAR